LTRYSRAQNDNYDADDETHKDKNLMPPPPTPSIQSQVEVNQDGAEKRRLDTPLAAMLPSKYANVDVTELFPDFRHGKVSFS